MRPCGAYFVEVGVTPGYELILMRMIMKFQGVEYLEEWELPLSAGMTVKPPLEDSSDLMMPHDLDLTRQV